MQPSAEYTSQTSRTLLQCCSVGSISPAKYLLTLLLRWGLFNEVSTQPQRPVKWLGKLIMGRLAESLADPA
jgi:hypothetical protein